MSESINPASAALLPSKVIENLSELLTEIPEDSIISRVIWKNDKVNATLFGFAAGQALSDHSAGQPAIVQILHGEAQITLGDSADQSVVEGTPGTWIYMPARLSHSVHAHTPMQMLLLLLKS